ncbi:MAG: hypothetical protein ACE14V_12675 [bacterium]
MSKWEEEKDRNDWDEETDWDEDRWEEYFQEQERRADYYTQKFEQSLKKYEAAEYPDPLEEAFNDIFPALDGSSSPEESNEMDDLFFGTEPDSDTEIAEPAWAQDEPTEDYDDFRKIYAYQLAYEFGIAIHHFVEPFFKTPIKATALYQLHDLEFQVASHIACGHAYGYEREGIVANIAKCKRALKTVNICIDAILKIKSHKIATPNQIDTLFQQAIVVRDAIINWIEELRSMVWW